jgi:hypothetical protein
VLGASPNVAALNPEKNISTKAHRFFDFAVPLQEQKGFWNFF